MDKMRCVIGVALSIFLSAPSISVGQPPPPPPGMPAYVTLLNHAYNERNLWSYRDLFRPDVKTYLDGRLVARDRGSLLARLQAEFDRNLHLRTLAWAQGAQILVMEEVSGCVPVNPNPNTVYHGCYTTRSVRYDLAEDDKIEAVHILDADRAWNVHAGPP